MAGPGKNAGRQPLYGAAIPLAKPVTLDGDQLFKQLRGVVAMAGAGVRKLDDSGAKRSILPSLRRRPAEFTFEIAGVRLVIQAVGRPLCDASTMHSFINPSLWKGTLGGIAGHRAHLMIAEAEAAGAGSGASGGRDAMFDRATAVTLATAAVASMVEAEGVIWLPARNALPMGTFGSEMERFIDGQAPLQFWLRWQVLPAPVQAEREFGALSGEALNPGVATIGLTAFIGAEVIAPPSIAERDVMLDHIFALASAAIDENVDFKDGAVYGKPDGTMVRLSLRKNGQYSERPYWELLPRPAAASKEPDASDPRAKVGGDGSPERRLRLVVPGGS